MMAFMRAMVCVLCGVLVFSGVNIPYSIAESNTKEVNQTGEKDSVPSYANMLNIPLDLLDSVTRNNNPIATLYDLTWLCLKINEKNTLLLTVKDPIRYFASSGPFDDPQNNDSPYEDDRIYFSARKQTIEDMIRYLDMTHFTDRLIIDGFLIIDIFYGKKLIGILNFDEFFPNRNFFNKREDIELVFLTNNINELANLISIDLNEYNLSERIKNSIQDRSIEISFKDMYDLYMTIVPDEYLPAITQRKFNINPTVPIFKDEILEKKVNERSEELGFYVLPMKSGETKFLFYYLDSKALYYYDFYTGEKISSYGNYDFNKEYLNKLGVSDDFYIEDSNGVFNYDKTMSNIRADIVEEYFPGLTYLLTISSTYGDFVEFYQKIPLNQQIDYSFYDFSQSPIIEDYDPAWFADRPAFVPMPVPTPSPVPTPTPTPPTYAELTLGSRGQEVLDMKARFYELGYFRTNQFNDQYSRNTADTVKLFEKNNGLPADGVADPTMLGVLFSDSAVGK